MRNLREQGKRTVTYRLPLVGLSLSMGAGFAGQYVMVPLYPELAKDRGMATETAGLLFSSPSAAFCLFGPIWGILVSINPNTVVPRLTNLIRSTKGLLKHKGLKANL
jgi:cyanate permease